MMTGYAQDSDAKKSQEYQRRISRVSECKLDGATSLCFEKEMRIGHMYCLIGPIKRVWLFGILFQPRSVDHAHRRAYPMSQKRDNSSCYINLMYVLMDHCALVDKFERSQHDQVSYEFDYCALIDFQAQNTGASHLHYPVEHHRELTNGVCST